MHILDDDFETSFFQRFYYKSSIIYQRYLDKITPFILFRWIFTVLLVIYYAWRIYMFRGFHIISYALAIYLLNLLLGFLTPKIDPSNGKSSSQLPISRNDEFRPFLRKFPEFNVWLSSTRAFIIGVTCTCFTILDVPVFWPILVIYFVLLFSLTMKQQIKHMIKYKYLPFTYGKPHHSSKNSTIHLIK